MHKRTYMELSSFIVLLSIATIVLQFVTYYFIASVWIVVGISSLISLIFHHIIVEQSQSYQASFDMTLMTVFISTLILALTYYGKNQDFIYYSTDIIGIIVINWLIPTLYSYIRSMLDTNGRIEAFSSFYRNSSILFLLFYVVILLYGSFNFSAFPWAYSAITGQPNFSPFETIATQIENYLNHMVSLGDIFIYLGSRILIFIPYGYFATLVLRRRPRYIRWIALLLFPLILELFQYFLVTERCDIDDIIYGLLGGVLGTLFYILNNLIYRGVSGKNFLANSSDYRYSGHSLHF